MSSLNDVDESKSDSAVSRRAEELLHLTCEQFSLGVKNTVELITAQNELISAQQEVLQAKYMTMLNLELLNIYQGKKNPIIR